MSKTKHGVTCRCGDCYELNVLYVEADRIAIKMIEAQRAREGGKVSILCTELEQKNSQIAELGARLGR